MAYRGEPYDALLVDWQLPDGSGLQWLRERRAAGDATRAQQVTISGEDFWISADGEISGPEKRRSWHLEPAAYRLIVPA
jgi:hypothetical protein